MNFLEHAIEVGFTTEQAEFMQEWLAMVVHSHAISDVEGLEDALEEDDEDEEDGEETDED